MNKFFFLLFVLLSSQGFSQDLETTSEVVDAMAPIEEELETEVLELDTVLAPEEALPVAEGAALVETAPVVDQVSIVSAPTPTSVAQVEGPDDFNPRKGHWLTSLGFEALEYKVPLDFQGSNKKFNRENRILYGGRLGFGREFYLGRGFNSTSKIEGFYMGTLFEEKINAAPEETTVEFASTKKTGQIWGAEFTQSLGMLFDLKTKNPFLDEMTYLTVEPFVFAGIGRASAYNRIAYLFDLTPSEEYRIRIEDDITSASWGGGINFTSSSGFFMYLKATQYQLNVTKRTERGFSKTANTAGSFFENEFSNVDVKPITIYALGGGYKF